MVSASTQTYITCPGEPGTGTPQSKLVRDTLKSEPRGTIEAVDIRDAATLQPVSGAFAKPIVVLLTVKFGSVRLIDNRVYAA